MTYNSRINYWKLLLTVIAVEALGFASSILSGNVRDSYNELTLPPLSPPGPVFGIVWPILYLFVGVAGYLIWINRDYSPTATWLFFIQLALNFSWTIVFFNFSMLWLGVIIILAMDIIVIVIIIKLGPGQLALSKWLLTPYLIWILFATYLAISVALFN